MNFSWPVKLKASFGALVSCLFVVARRVRVGVVRVVVGLHLHSISWSSPEPAGRSRIRNGACTTENDEHI